MSREQAIFLVAGARPNFIKLAPLARELGGRGRLRLRIVHTGQHWDDALSGSFFRVLGIPAPDFDLEVGAGSQGAQTGRILERFEALLAAEPAALVVVFGDVTSTLACALAAAKLRVPVAHVEAGLRSFDRTMPEEINRIVTDLLAELLLVSEPAGIDNLANQGITGDRVALVGNLMIDSLVRALPAAGERAAHRRFGLAAGEYTLLTLHRPSNVDDPAVLARLLDVLGRIAAELPIVFPVHPRTRARVAEAGLRWPDPARFHAVDPVDYVDMVSLQGDARVVLTDSGGLQEETSYLRVPCLTLRDTTERPITVDRGTSTLVGNDPERIWAAFSRVLAGDYPTGANIPLWDGRAAGRIADRIEGFVESA